MQLHEVEEGVKTVRVKIRHRLYCRLNDENKGTVVWIGLNPSKADKYHTDDTMEYCKHLLDRDYSEMIVYNLFECYSTESDRIVSQTAADFSAESVQRDLKAAKDIFVAWGVSGFREEKERAAKELEAYSGKLKCVTRPGGEAKTYHPLRFGKNVEIRKLNLKQCRA